MEREPLAVPAGGAVVGHWTVPCPGSCWYRTQCEYEDRQHGARLTMSFRRIRKTDGSCSNAL